MKLKGEPFFRGAKFTGTVSEALQWYRKHSTPGEQKEWLIAFLVEHNQSTRLPFTDDKPFPEAVMERVRNCDSKDAIGMGSVARLLHRGVTLDKKTVDRFHSQILALKAKVKPERQPKVIIVTSAAMSKIYQQIDTAIDDMSRSPRPKPPAKEPWRETLQPDQMALISARYKRTYDEILAAAEESDKELVEAYGNLSVRQMDALVSYLESLVILKKPKKAKA